METWDARPIRRSCISRWRSPRRNMRRWRADGSMSALDWWGGVAARRLCTRRHCAASWTRAVPELPEVEGYRRFFERHAVGRPIASVACRDPLVVGTLGRKDLDRVLPGRLFQSTRRHGKYLFAEAAV